MDNLKISEIVKAIDAKNGTDIEVFDISKLSSEMEVFVIATGSSDRNTMAIADEIEYQLKKSDILASHKEGYRNGRWILLDYGDVVVHIFKAEERMFYNLEKLWSGSVRLDVDSLLENN
ncbi:MAG: ribosome silencing factor [Peptostreptococcaceae bacterium]|nr:ribosome silencing factor [Peptostreptococcaceae bacterium]